MLLGKGKRNRRLVFCKAFGTILHNTAKSEIHGLIDGLFNR